MANWKTVLQYMCPVCGNMQNEPTPHCCRCSSLVTVEENGLSHNTGSPKLPTLEECERWYVKNRCGFEYITELEKNVIREVHGLMILQHCKGGKRMFNEISLQKEIENV